jgi:NitT/TauT family transport system ATP-binding protein
MSQDFSI